MHPMVEMIMKYFITLAMAMATGHVLPEGIFTTGFRTENSCQFLFSALRALYISTGSMLKGWDSSTPNMSSYCTWEGIFCVGGEITSLYLSGQSLKGTLPRQIGYLTSLTRLGIFDCSLSGTIPTELGLLTNLQQLYLNSNSLVGSIPTELGQMVNLKRLSLYDNSLVSSIPSALAGMRTLQGAYLYSNSLIGSIPSELATISNLQGLYLYSNSLSGNIPSSIGHMSALIYLYLYSNELVGSIPTELGKLRNVKYFHLYSNSLVGSIPHELGRLSSLRGLSLYSNSISGTIPSALAQMANLQNAYLHDNNFVGSIPSQLGVMTKLQTLYLNSNCLSGSVPSTFSRLKNILKLSLSSNQFEGSFPISALVGMTNLRWLHLASNSLVGSIPEDLGRLTKLVQISLNSNCLTGTIPSDLENLNKLQDLILNENSLSGSIPTSLALLTNLKHLTLSSNSFVGVIPSALCSSNSLQAITVGGNMGLTCYPGCFTALSQSLFDANISACAPSSSPSSSLSSSPSSQNPPYSPSYSQRTSYPSFSPPSSRSSPSPHAPQISSKPVSILPHNSYFPSGSPTLRVPYPTQPLMTASPWPVQNVSHTSLFIQTDNRSVEDLNIIIICSILISTVVACLFVCLLCFVSKISKKSIGMRYYAKSGCDDRLLTTLLENDVDPSQAITSDREETQSTLPLFPLSSIVGRPGESSERLDQIFGGTLVESSSTNSPRSSLPSWITSGVASSLRRLPSISTIEGNNPLPPTDIVLVAGNGNDCMDRDGCVHDHNSACRAGNGCDEFDISSVYVSDKDSFQGDVTTTGSHEGDGSGGSDGIIDIRHEPSFHLFDCGPSLLLPLDAMVGRSGERTECSGQIVEGTLVDATPTRCPRSPSLVASSSRRLPCRSGLEGIQPLPLTDLLVAAGNGNARTDRYGRVFDHNSAGNGCDDFDLASVYASDKDSFQGDGTTTGSHEGDGSGGSDGIIDIRHEPSFHLFVEGTLVDATPTRCPRSPSPVASSSGRLPPRSTFEEINPLALTDLLVAAGNGNARMDRYGRVHDNNSAGRAGNGCDEFDIAVGRARSRWKSVEVDRGQYDSQSRK